MSRLYEYPAKSTFGRILPKNKIYEHAKPTAAVKELFIRQVDQIVWQYKLAPETINLPSTNSVPEIQIFHVTLKNGELKEDVLHCIDKAIPFPLIFELRSDNRCKMIASYKRPNEADSSKWVVSEYFSTGWMPESTARSALPGALDLSALYESLLSPLMPYPAIGRETLQAQTARIEKICVKERELEQAKTRLKNEQQFNRKVEINAEIRNISRKIESLTTTAATG